MLSIQTFLPGQSIDAVRKKEVAVEKRSMSHKPFVLFNERTPLATAINLIDHLETFIKSIPVFCVSLFHTGDLLKV